MTRRMHSRLAALLVLPLCGVAACGSVNAGDEAKAQFTQWMAGTANVVDLDLSSSNTLPWSGSMAARIVVSPGASVGELDAVAQRATRFVASNATTTFSLAYTTPGFKADIAVVTGADADNRELIQIAAAVDAGTAATVFTATATGDPDVAAGITVTDDDDFLAVFDQVRALTASKHLRTGDLLTVRNTAGTFSVAADRSPGAPGPRAAYDAVHAAFPVTEAHITESRLDVRVDADESPAVVTLARQVAPHVLTTAQFRNVTTTGEGDFTAARAVLTAARAAGTISAAELSPDSVTLTVPDPATMTAVHDAVGAGPQGPGVSVDVATSDGTFEVYSSTGPLAPFVSTLTALSGAGQPTLTRVAVSGDVLAVETSDLTEAQARALGAALSGAPDGETIDVQPGPAPSLRFVSAPSITMATVLTNRVREPSSRALVEAFVAGWNSLP